MAFVTIPVGGSQERCSGDVASPMAEIASTPADPQPVYTVRFAARELFGDGDHDVTVDVWESHLHPAGPEGAR